MERRRKEKEEIQGRGRDDGIRGGLEKEEGRESRKGGERGQK